MPCNTCKLQFTLFKRKRSCLSCHHFYCVNCLGRRRKNVCIRCEIIHSSSKNELMLLKTKDLIFFLQSRKIDISGVVEKEELCNLIINHISSNSYYESITANSSPSSNPSDFENLTHNFDQIKQTCQSFFTSISEKIATDFQKTTCFNNQASQHDKKENVTIQQPKSNFQTSSVNSQNLQNPGTSGLQNIQQSNIQIDIQNVNCECCSDEELTEISEKRQSILNSDINEFLNNAKKAKISDASSDSSFEEVPASVIGKPSDEDWLLIENEKSESSSNDKPMQAHTSGTLEQENNMSDTFVRRKSESSLLKLKKLDITCSNQLAKAKILCKKCGNPRSKIKEEILKLNDQLKSSNRSKDEICTKMKLFIDYLDNKFESQSDAVNNTTTTNPLPHVSPSTSFDQNSENHSNESTNAEAIIDQKNDNQPSCSFNPAKRFITLDEIQSSTDLESLSVKQLKELLALNRVDYKGCCEKKELMERVQRLWESYTDAPPSDRLSSNDLCKICMDAPIECVFLECGHSVTCTACGKILSECPICRSYIVRVVRIFKS